MREADYEPIYDKSAASMKQLKQEDEEEAKQEITARQPEKASIQQEKANQKKKDKKEKSFGRRDYR
ncbi:unnamed protein product [Prunus armeniaca]|uniref:Uncharacterized protein n=1 Tax=Prunus armeniaca TaxID=36596 RepID=A0A6J5V4N3_PRUAR|nr:unnamed protein product [Prunus armeniaca]CAB4311378.1 unnamed protein product [Prunus armeniaca]